MIAALLAFSSTLIKLDAIDTTLASRYFQEARWIASDDASGLWGKPLYGPMVFVDRRTRTAVANQLPPLPGFEAKGDLFVGKFPENVGIANTAYTFGESRWTVVIWPLPQNRAERATLIMHELFHRIQLDLGFPGSSPKNAHLETLQGRLWLQMEFAALAKALATTEAIVREAATVDALVFRAFRQSKFPGSKSEEDALDLNEGLAQYTGYMLRGGFEPETRIWLANQLRQMGGKESYTRTFAYWTGSAYGYLLNVGEATKYDEIRWRKKLKSDSSLAGEMAAFLSFDGNASEEDAIARANLYGYDDVLARERAIEALRNERIASVRKQFFESPALILPLEKMNIAFDPGAILSLGTDGTYYKTATLNNAWGKLEVTDGVVVASDFKTARVVAPSSAASQEGAGWKIELKEGWKIVAGDKAGDYKLVKGTLDLRA